MGSSCARCGACLSVCPVYMVSGIERHSPRGKNYLISEYLTKHKVPNLSYPLKETLAACLQCGACSDLCSANVDVKGIIQDARKNYPEYSSSSRLIQKALKTASSFPELTSTLASIPAGAGITRRLLQLLSREDKATGISLPVFATHPALSDKGIKKIMNQAESQGNFSLRVPVSTVSIFTGCLQNFLYPEVVSSMTMWFKARISIPPGQSCCGLPAWSAGDMEQTVDIVRKNIHVFRNSMPEILLTGCVSCAGMIRKWPELPGLKPLEREAALEIASRVREFTEFISEFELIPEHITLKNPVTFHVPCHQRFGDNSSNPEELVAKISGNMFKPSEKRCCGQGGGFGLSFPVMSEKIFHKRQETLVESGAETVITNCSACLMQLKQNFSKSNINVIDRKIEVVHMAELIKL